MIWHDGRGGGECLYISFCAHRKGKVKWRKEEIVHNFFNENSKAGEKRLGRHL